MPGLGFGDFIDFNFDSAIVLSRELAVTDFSFFELLVLLDFYRF